MGYALAVSPIEQAAVLSGGFRSAPWNVESIAISFVLCLLAGCLFSSIVRKTVADVFAVFAIGSGTGILTWAICSTVRNEEVRSLAALPTMVTTPSDAIGLGSGLMAAGIVALLLTYALPRRSRAKAPPVAAAIGLCRDPRQTVRRRSAKPPAAATIGLHRRHG